MTSCTGSRMIFSAMFAHAHLPAPADILRAAAAFATTVANVYGVGVSDESECTWAESVGFLYCW
jgi:hypothetical protein